MRNTTYKRESTYLLPLRRMKVSFLFLVLMIMNARNIHAQTIVVADTLQKYHVQYPEFLEDANSSLSFEEVVSQGYHFLKAKDKTPDFLGNFSTAVWYRFTVENKSDTNSWFLEVKAGFMDDVAVYQIKENGRVSVLTLNGNQRFRSKPISSNNLIFPLIISKNTKDQIYVCATSKTLIRTSMSISTMPKLYEDSIFTSYGDGFFTAVAIALLLYNLFVYFMLREKVYLHYIGYISAAIVHNNVAAGHFQTFFPLPDWLNSTTILPVMCFFSILFTNSFLQAKQFAPFIYKLRSVLIIACVIPLICYALGCYRLAILESAVLIFTLCIYWVFAGSVAYRNGFAPAIFYLGGYGVLVFVSVIYELKMKGLAPENYWTDSSLFIGVAIEAVILSFALANKFNFYKKEKERLQEEAYQKAIHFSRELINMQEVERKRIASELHDSLGQKLVLIKNKLLRAKISDSITYANHEESDALAQNVAEAIQEIRNISYALRPYQLDLLGLASSLKSMASESLDVAQIEYSIQIAPIDKLFDADAQINIYRIIQECINNIIKHSEAKKVQINIKHDTNSIKISISDDGVGFDLNGNHTGFGLKGIKERLQILEGTMTISANGEKGTVFEFLIPL